MICEMVLLEPALSTAMGEVVRTGNCAWELGRLLSTALSTSEPPVVSGCRPRGEL
jgi:hypothetical protein